MRIRFSVPVLPTIAAAILLLVFTALGFWQLDRAAQKRETLRTFEEGGRDQPAELPHVLDEPQHWQHRVVQVSGRFDSERQFLLDNRVSHGKPGFHVLTPLRLDDSQPAVLVDRGWVAQGALRSEHPDVDVTSAVMKLAGRIYVPGKAFALGGIDDGETAWPRVVQFIDFDVLAGRLGYPLRPFTIRMDPDVAHGYRREWQVVTFPPERHIGYAFQWFALAVALVAIYLVVNFKRSDRDA